MKEVSQPQVKEALQALGFQPGDGVLAHSAVQYLGRPQGGLETYYQALAEVLVLPTAGTLAVPAFNFAFARGEAYDPAATPAAGMGAFSEWLRGQPGVRRTPHPLQSLAVTGRQAADLAGRDTPSAFDPGSAFERMLELDFKLLLLGADIQAVSMLHYSEQRLDVPYRYWKEFSGPYRTAEGWENRTYRMFARDLDMDARLSLTPVQDVMQQRGLWRAVPLNYGTVAACRLADFVAVVDEFLSADPWSLLTNREQAYRVYREKQKIL